MCLELRVGHKCTFDGKGINRTNLRDIHVMGTIPSVTVTIGDIYELVIDIVVVPEVDELFEHDVLLESLIP